MLIGVTFVLCQSKCDAVDVFRNTWNAHKASFRDDVMNRGRQGELSAFLNYYGGVFMVM